MERRSIWPEVPVLRYLLVLSLNNFVFYLHWRPTVGVHRSFSFWPLRSLEKRDRSGGIDFMGIFFHVATWFWSDFCQGAVFPKTRLPFFFFFISLSVLNMRSIVLFLTPFPVYGLSGLSNSLFPIRFFLLPEFLGQKQEQLPFVQDGPPDLRHNLSYPRARRVVVPYNVRDDSLFFSQSLELFETLFPTSCPGLLVGGDLSLFCILTSPGSFSPCGDESNPFH